jgi:protein TonB
MAEHAMNLPVSNAACPEVATMFQDSLLESSNVARKSKDKRRSMTLAFVLELIVAAFILLVPLMSTGVIPVAHVLACPYIAPFHSAEVADQSQNNSTGQRSATAKPTEVVRISNNNAPLLPFGQSRLPIDPGNIPPGQIQTGDGPKSRIGDLICKSDCIAIPTQDIHRRPVQLSHLSEAFLVRRIDPVYPRTAVIAHVFGEVQLHAIIAKDGSIQSLNVISGSPILAQAALDAVRQWRYKPYMLNDQAVEVETFITVHFRPASN